MTPRGPFFYCYYINPLRKTVCVHHIIKTRLGCDDDGPLTTQPTISHGSIPLSAITPSRHLHPGPVYITRGSVNNNNNNSMIFFFPVAFSFARYLAPKRFFPSYFFLWITKSESVARWDYIRKFALCPVAL